MEVTRGCWRKLQLIISIRHLVTFGRLNQGGWDGDDIMHAYKVVNAYNVSVEKPGGKRPLERPRHRWKDNIKMELE
jgi:hypothetical protein